MATYFNRRADAVWKGGGKDGQGTLTTASGVLSGTAYSAGRRFGDEPGTNPEELIAAAHAGCFAMALAFQISGAGHQADELQVSAEVRVEKDDAGWTIKSVELTLNGRVPGLSEDEFKQLAEKAKAGCPVSRVLNAEISLKSSFGG